MLSVNGDFTNNSTGSLLLSTRATLEAANFYNYGAVDRGTIVTDNDVQYGGSTGSTCSVHIVGNVRMYDGLFRPAVDGSLTQYGGSPDRERI